MAVVVNGRARSVHSARYSESEAGRGLLVINNAQRSDYTNDLRRQYGGQFETVNDSFAPAPYHNNFSVTLMLRKIAS